MKRKTICGSVSYSWSVAGEATAPRAYRCELPTKHKGPHRSHLNKRVIVEWPRVEKRQAEAAESYLSAWQEVNSEIENIEADAADIIFRLKVVKGHLVTITNQGKTGPVQ